MRVEDVAVDTAVEWLGPDDARVGLQKGHPGRIEDPNPDNLFVEWVGLEYGMASRVSYGPDSLGLLTDVEFARRAARVVRGEAPQP